MNLKLIIVKLTLVAVCYCQDPPETNTPLVLTKLGQIQGFNRLSFNLNPYSAFEGIPYAQAPVGRLRFQDPEPVEPWSGVWKATQVNECAQVEMVDMDIMFGDEDCLFLNIYIPRLNPNPWEKLDVVVHLHGGAFNYGSGNELAHPGFFMDTDLIFITLNYRLGIFGFLSTEDDVISGNFGLKDQVLALKWIQENIAAFGGNPDSVTLTGFSAGGASTHFHYFSPMSKGLFHRGFSQSGTALNPSQIQKNALQRAQQLGSLVGCDTSNTTELVYCLRQRPFRELLGTMSTFYGIRSSPLSPFAPVVENSSNPFLDSDPYTLLDNKQILDVPWIASNCLNEGLMPTDLFLDELSVINDRWEEVAPFILEYNDTVPLSARSRTAQLIKDHYFGLGQNINILSFLRFVQAATDRLYLTGSETSIRRQAEVNTAPVYYYLMTYPGNGRETNGCDLKYYFNSKESVVLEENELEIKEALFEMITSYAKTGKPIIEGVLWESISTDEELTVLNITGFDRSTGFNVQKILELSDREFWDSIGLLYN